MTNYKNEYCYSSSEFLFCWSQRSLYAIFIVFNHTYELINVVIDPNYITTNRSKLSQSMVSLCLAGLRDNVAQLNWVSIRFSTFSVLLDTMNC